MEQARNEIKIYCGAPQIVNTITIISDQGETEIVSFNEKSGVLKIRINRKPYS